MQSGVWRVTVDWYRLYKYTDINIWSGCIVLFLPFLESMKSQMQKGEKKQNRRNSKMTSFHTFLPKSGDWSWHLILNFVKFFKALKGVKTFIKTRTRYFHRVEHQMRLFIPYYTTTIIIQYNTRSKYFINRLSVVSYCLLIISI